MFDDQYRSFHIQSSMLLAFFYSTYSYKNPWPCYIRLFSYRNVAIENQPNHISRTNQKTYFKADPKLLEKLMSNIFIFSDSIIAIVINQNPNMNFKCTAHNDYHVRTHFF